MIFAHGQNRKHDRDRGGDHCSSSTGESRESFQLTQSCSDDRRRCQPGPQDLRQRIQGLPRAFSGLTLTSFAHTRLATLWPSACFAHLSGKVFSLSGGGPEGARCFRGDGGTLPSPSGFPGRSPSRSHLIPGFSTMSTQSTRQREPTAAGIYL